MQFNLSYSIFQDEKVEEIHLRQNGKILTVSDAISSSNENRGLLIQEFNDFGEILWQDHVVLDSFLLFTQFKHCSFIHNDSVLILFGPARKAESLKGLPFFLKYNLNTKSLVDTSFFEFELSSPIYTSLYHDNFIYGGGYLRKDSNNFWDQDALLMKLDLDGNLVWQKTHDLDGGDSNEGIVDIEPLDETKLVLSVYASNAVKQQQELGVLIIDTSGNILNTNKDLHASALQGGINSVRVLNHGIYYCSNTRDRIIEHETTKLYKLDTSLNVEWQKDLGQTSKYGIIKYEHKIIDDQIIYVGAIDEALEYTNGRTWGYAASYSLDGDFNWEHVYHFDSGFSNRIIDFEQLTDGSLVFAGNLFNWKSPPDDDHLLWLFRTDETGCLLPFDSCKYDLNDYFDIEVNTYPEIDYGLNIKINGNPFCQSFNFSSENFENGHTYQISSIHGKIVDEGLLDNYININTSNWSSGLYLLNIFYENESIYSKKIIKQQ